IAAAAARAGAALAAIIAAADRRDRAAGAGAVAGARRDQPVAGIAGGRGTLAAGRELGAGPARTGEIAGPAQHGAVVVAAPAVGGAAVPLPQAHQVEVGADLALGDHQHVDATLRQHHAGARSPPLDAQ